MSETASDTLTGEYQIDPAHSSFAFVARHAMITKVRGQFGDAEGTLDLNASDPARSQGHIRLKTASIDTGQQQRDEHLRSADFFEVERYPEIVFRSTAIEAQDAAHFRVTGDLTILETTRPVSIDVEFTGEVDDPMGNHRVGLEGSVQVNRKDWNLTWNAALETGGVLISEKVTIQVDISAIKQDT